MYSVFNTGHSRVIIYEHYFARHSIILLSYYYVVAVVSLSLQLINYLSRSSQSTQVPIFPGRVSYDVYSSF